MKGNFIHRQECVIRPYIKICVLSKYGVDLIHPEPFTHDMLHTSCRYHVKVISLKFLLQHILGSWCMRFEVKLSN